jgi:hypothetical protein
MAGGPVVMSGPSRHASDAIREKSFNWDDPTALAAAGAELSSRRVLQATVDGRLPAPPIATLIAAELVSVGEGEAEFRYPPDESTYNRIVDTTSVLDDHRAALAHSARDGEGRYAKVLFTFEAGS